MPDLNSIWAGTIAVLTILFLLNTILKKPHPIMNSVKSALTGVSGIMLLSASAIYTGITVPLNIISLGLAAILGLPGVGTLMILNSLLAC